MRQAARQLAACAALAVGFSLFAAASLAGGARDAKSGGTLRINISNSDIGNIDPQIDYDFYGWQVSFYTCVRLLSYPDAPAPRGSQLVPEAAAGMPSISRDGRTYTFRVRPGIRFNTGETVGPANFRRSIERALSPKMASPAASFLQDLAGAGPVLAGKAKTPSGIKVAGDQISFRLTQAAPDFLARLAMAFFCAVPVSFPIDGKGVQPPGAGPYYISKRTPNREIVLDRNPNYRGSRPRNPDRIVITVQTSQAASYLQVRRGEADYDLAGIPPQDYAQTAKTYGVNKGRLFVSPGLSVQYVALNVSRPAFQEADVRRAVNFALNRKAIEQQNGYLAGATTDQVLPPGMRGFRNGKIYPLDAPNAARAKQLLAGKDVGTIVLYTTTDASNVAAATVIQANLKQVGLDVEIKRYSFGVLVNKIGVIDEPFDMVLIGWFADYADPYDFINILLDGRNITKSNNVNLAHFDDATFNKRMRQAALITGTRRYATYGKLDVDIMRVAAPWAALYNSNTRDFVSARIGCYIYHPVYAAMDLGAACIK